MHATHLLDLIYVPTKNYQVISVWELWPAQDFCIRGDNNGETESTLEHNMPTGPYLFLYQLSKYFKPHTQGFSLEIHSGEVTRKQPQQRLSLLHVTHLQILSKYV